jgi:major membrane immunogen (membrane-anchored lipoprotein)
MQRYQLILGGTVAGIAGVLAFPTHHTKLSLPSTGVSGTTSSAGTSTAAGPASSGSASSSSGTSSVSPSGSSSSTTSKSATSADEQFRFGDLAVKVTVSGSKITNVAVTTMNEYDGRSASIDQYAVPQLEQQVISANSVNINGVSGATFTSQAFVDAVANALQKLGFQP